MVYEFFRHLLGIIAAMFAVTVFMIWPTWITHSLGLYLIIEACQVAVVGAAMMTFGDQL